MGRQGRTGCMTHDERAQHATSRNGQTHNVMNGAVVQTGNVFGGVTIA